MHKQHDYGTTPPERQIVSGCGAYFENTSKFVQHYISEISTKHLTCIQDTPDFLRYIKNKNQKEELPGNAILSTFDATGLFTNVPKEDGLDALRDALEERTDKQISQLPRSELLKRVAKPANTKRPVFAVT